MEEKNELYKIVMLFLLTFAKGNGSILVIWGICAILVLWGGCFCFVFDGWAEKFKSYIIKVILQLKYFKEKFCKVKKI